MKKAVLVLFSLACIPLWAAIYRGDISLDKSDGFYKCGEKAVCTVVFKKDKKPLSGEKVRLLLKKEGKVILRKTFVTNGKPIRYSHTLDAPGWLYFGFEILDENGKPLKNQWKRKQRSKPTIVTEIGALFDAFKIKTASPCPADFGKFWQDKRAALDKVALKPVLTEIPSGNKKAKLYKVSIPCIGSRPATGYLAVPAGAKPGSCPAVVQFLSWSSVDAGRKDAVAKAARGILTLSASWHGFPAGHPKSYYVKNISRAVKGGRVHIGDRDKWVMGEVYYRVMREMDFIKSRPEWDKKTLVASGGSLGGAQAAAAAALDKDVTIALIGVPCFAEFDTRKSGRKGSIPHRYNKVISKGDNRPYEAAAYFDLVNLAPRITCEVYVSTGFTDELCPPSNVLAFYNALNPKCKKMLSTNPRTGHFGTTKNIKGNKRLEKLVQSVTVDSYTEKY